MKCRMGLTSLFSLGMRNRGHKFQKKLSSAQRGWYIGDQEIRWGLGTKLKLVTTGHNPLYPGVRVLSTKQSKESIAVSH